MQKAFDIFCKKVNDVLQKHTVYAQRAAPERLPSKQIRAMLERRSKFLQGSKECKEINEEVRQAARKLREKEALRRIKRGTEALRNGDTRNAWKWLKREASLSGGTNENTAI